MELKYPYILFFLIIISICLFFFLNKKNTKYVSGSKIANTHYIKDSNYYKEKMKKYNTIKKITLSLFFISFITSSILLSRLIKVQTVKTNQRNRDIYLCMDVSSSVDELNLELVETLKNTVKELQGERFGISIFNTSSVTLVPLTDDYNYVIDTLNQIKKSLDSSSNYSSKDYLYLRNYIYSGTLEGNKERGSSLIGDGYASCVYNFSKKDKNRTKIIILSTDNDLAGKPLVTLDEASQISKNNNVITFGIGTRLMKSNDKSEFKNAVLKTGGKFYEHSYNNVHSIVSDIESTSKSLLNNKTEVKKVDIPQIPFVILLFSVLGILIIEKKVL